MPPAVITLSSDEEMAPPPPNSAPKSSATAKKPLPKRKIVESSDDSDQDVKPKPKPLVKLKSIASTSSTSTTAATKTNVLAKKADNSSEDDDQSDSDDDDDDKKKKGKGKAKPKPSTVTKKPSAKKPKTEDGAEDGSKEKKVVPKWVFKGKTGPVAPGSKDIPMGKDNCLAGLTFVFTGELSSLSREEGQDLAKRYGGRVTSAPSSKTSYVVLGSEAGPKKLEMIAKHKIKTLDEDGFLELIGKRPSGASDPKFIEAKKKEEEQIKEAAKTLGGGKGKIGVVENKTQLWTVKYAPTKLSEICGNKGSVEKLSKWLELWPKSLASDFKKPGPDAMGGFRCVLISGPPGIGKTTAAHLVANLLGYNVLELNASDTRSKKLLESAFKSTIDNTTLSGLFKTATSAEGEEADLKVNRKSLIIMDEVDGMSAGDRGGVGALNTLIKKTKVPIIAICNDKTTPKMKPLQSTCFQMIFKRPAANEIRGRMMTVAFKEGITVDGKVMDQLVAGSQSDIRQIVNMLSTWKLGAKAMDFDEGKQLAKMNEKNSIQTPWNLYGKLFGPQAFSPVSGMTLNEKLDIYFSDHSLMPLFVQDNYLKANFSKASGLMGHDLALKNLELMSKAADAISEGDLVDRMIHGQQEWSLMPVHGMFSCVRPGYYCHGSGGGFPGFPSWFGKNSTQTKLHRLLGDIKIHMRLKVSGDRSEIRQSYIPTLFGRLVNPLQEKGADAIEEVIQLLDDYYLNKDDWDAIVELGVGEDYAQEGVLKKIPSSVKSAFTRAYNKSDHPVAFNREGGKVSKKRASGGGGDVPDFEGFVADDMDDVGDDEDAGNDSSSSLGEDKLIKSKGKAKAKETKLKAVGKPKAASKPKAVSKAPAKPRKSK